LDFKPANFLKILEDNYAKRETQEVAIHQQQMMIIIKISSQRS
jgi:hypothetical protein